MRRIARSVVAWMARRLSDQAQVGACVWRDVHGAGLMFTDDLGTGYIVYFDVNEARNWGDALLTAAYHHAEGFPIPLEPENERARSD